MPLLLHYNLFIIVVRTHYYHYCELLNSIPINSILSNILKMAAFW